jgi:hypothetical protein
MDNNFGFEGTYFKATQGQNYHLKKFVNFGRNGFIKSTPGSTFTAIVRVRRIRAEQAAPRGGADFRRQKTQT